MRTYGAEYMGIFSDIVGGHSGAHWGTLEPFIALARSFTDKMRYILNWFIKKMSYAISGIVPGQPRFSFVSLTHPDRDDSLTVSVASLFPSLR